MATSRIPIEERFWNKVDRTPGHGPRGDYWHWIGYRMKNGYGTIGFRGSRSALTHRVAYEIATGRVPTRGMDIAHSCDNPPATALCVRALRRNPRTTFTAMRDRAKDRRIKLWPIQWGRAIEWLRQRGETCVAGRQRA